MAAEAELLPAQEPKSKGSEASAEASSQATGPVPQEIEMVTLSKSAKKAAKAKVSDEEFGDDANMNQGDEVEILTKSKVREKQLKPGNPGGASRGPEDDEMIDEKKLQ